jgi:hypothetical protein
VPAATPETSVVSTALQSRFPDTITLAKGRAVVQVTGVTGGVAGVYCQPNGYEGLNLLVHVEDLERDAVGIGEGEQ